eukprot:gene10072-biopygen22781
MCLHPCKDRHNPGGWCPRNHVSGDPGGGAALAGLQRFQQQQKGERGGGGGGSECAGAPPRAAQREEKRATQRGGQHRGGAGRWRRVHMERRTWSSTSWKERNPIVAKQCRGTPGSPYMNTDRPAPAKLRSRRSRGTDASGGAGQLQGSW